MSVCVSVSVSLCVCLCVCVSVCVSVTQIVGIQLQLLSGAAGSRWRYYKNTYLSGYSWQSSKYTSFAEAQDQCLANWGKHSTAFTFAIVVIEVFDND